MVIANLVGIERDGRPELGEGRIQVSLSKIVLTEGVVEVVVLGADIEGALEEIEPMIQNQPGAPRDSELELCYRHGVEQLAVGWLYFQSVLKPLQGSFSVTCSLIRLREEDMGKRIVGRDVCCLMP